MCYCGCGRTQHDEKSRLLHRFVTMKLTLVSVFLCSVVYGQKASFMKLPALDPKVHVEIGDRYISELKCIKKFDAVITARWTEELSKIPTSDLGNLPKIPWEDKESIYTKYNSLEDEWLMEGGSPAKKINECVQRVLSDVKTPGINQGDLDCLDGLLASNSEEEIYYQRDFENLINISSAEQLPFRKFISFLEVVNLIFQNRKPASWTSLEGLLYEHTKSYTHTEADETRRNYLASQNCEWKNAKAFQDAPSEVARLNEFTIQVRRTVNKQLAGLLVRDWDLDTILPKEKYQLWLKSRQEMTSKLEREVEELRKQSKDVQWLCEYATELATNFTHVQSSILLSEGKSTVHLEASDVASMAKTIEMAMPKVNDNDPRQAAIKKLADKQDEGTRCLSSLVRFVENHRRYELASQFIDEEYEFPEMYCENNIKNHGLTRFTFCNCIGSFCVSHYLAALFAEEYVLVKGSDGIYKIVRSGIMSKRKVWHCHTLANSSKN